MADSDFQGYSGYDDPTGQVADKPDSSRREDARLQELISGKNRHVGAHVFHSVNQSLANATVTYLAFDSEDYDSDGFHDPASNNSRLVVPEGQGGTYLLIAQVQFAQNATGLRQINFRVNRAGATAQVAFINQLAVSGLPTRITASHEIELGDGDYVELGAYQDSGVALDVVSTPEFSPRFILSKRGV